MFFKILPKGKVQKKRYNKTIPNSLRQNFMGTT
jgi:hypothetical protein